MTTTTEAGQLPFPVDLDAMTEPERKLLAAILPHQGRHNAIPVPEAAALANLSPRSAQHVCKALVERHKLPIGSSSASDCPGWYLCTDADELKAAHKALRSRALSILVRAKAFDPRRNEHLGPAFYSQLQLRLDGGPDAG